jgi:hypothetical protein
MDLLMKPSHQDNIKHFLPKECPSEPALDSESVSIFQKFLQLIEETLSKMKF